MSNKVITIAWRNGSPGFSPPPGVTFLRAGDTVTLRFTGVPNGAGSIDAVTIFANRVVDGEDVKGRQLCGWRRDGSDDCTMYDIQPSSATEVVITDIEHPTVDTRYWFSASGTGPGVEWEVDPELVNRPDG